MRRFLGIVPPEEFAAEVALWQRSLGHDITAPHVTVKAPNGLTDDLSWLGRVRGACLQVPPFQVTLDGVSTFGRRVIYLAVRGEGVRDLHEALLHAVSPAVRGAHEGRAAFTPHLTLVLAWEPLGVTFDEALASARGTFTRPVTFTASFVRLFVKRTPGRPYATEQDFPLVGQESAQQERPANS